jgi:hypothetical protein
VSLTAFTTDVIKNLAQDVGEQPVVPFTRRAIERAIQCVFVHSMTQRTPWTAGVQPRQREGTEIVGQSTESASFISGSVEEVARLLE